MRGLEGEEEGAVTDFKIKQYRSNRADWLHSKTSKDIFNVRWVLPT